MGIVTLANHVLPWSNRLARTDFISRPTYHPPTSIAISFRYGIGVVLIRIRGLLVNLPKLEELPRDAMVSEWSGPRWRQGPIPITSFSSSASAQIYDRPPLNPIRGKQSGDCTTAVRFRVSWVVFSASTSVGSLSACAARMRVGACDCHHSDVCRSSRSGSRPKRYPLAPKEIH